MKIGDVKVGERYAAHDEPGKSPRYISAEHGDLPREVEAIEIVKVEERVYGQAWVGSEARQTRTVRRVKVRVIDGVPKDSYYAKQISKAKPGAVLVIEAKNLVGLWKDLSKPVADAVKGREDREAQAAALEARVKKLGLKHSSSSVSMYGGKLRPSLSIYDDDVDKLLTLAEEGQGWRDLGKSYREAGVAS